jgi:hypothetical protein
MNARHVPAYTPRMERAPAANPTRIESPREAQVARGYEFSDVDQFQVEARADVVPANAASRERYARALAAEATIYGLPSVYQYAQMVVQAVDASSPTYTGFDAWYHQRDVATPEFDVFKTPNVDTLYSNAWLDLTEGPALIRLPPIRSRYYTLHFLDAYSNSTNLSSRTVGEEGGEFLVTPPDWDGSVPAGATRFRVASPYMWILMRILVHQSPEDVQEVRAVQDAVEIAPAAGVGRGDFVATSPEAAESDWRSFFAVLDFSLRANGHPVHEDAYVYRFRSIGLGGPRPLQLDTLDHGTRRGLETGFADAMELIRGARSQYADAVGDTGWISGSGGEDGFNYLRRAIRNLIGTGGNVTAEKIFFAAHTTASGEPLDASKTSYLVRLDPPPPVDGHWSLTLYPTATGLLYPNEIDRYAIAATTPGLEYDADGSLTVLIQHERPSNAANWLPAPAGEFYLDLRTWEPRAEIRRREWQPGPVTALS